MCAMPLDQPSEEIMLRQVIEICRRDDFEDVATAVIEASLRSSPVPTAQMDDLRTRLESYVGDILVAQRLLVLIAFTPDEVPRDIPLQLLTDDEMDELQSRVARLRMLYRPELTKAYQYDSEDDDNWATLQTRYSYLPAIANWRIELMIQKFDDSVFLLAGPPASWLRLVSYLLDQLTQTEGDPNELFLDSLPVYQESSEAFVSWLAAATSASQEVP